MLRELRVLRLFVGGDLTASVLPSSIVLLAALLNSPPDTAAQLLTATLTGLCLSVLYIYAFCLLNQLTGTREDLLNKPWRPLVTGAVTQRGAQVRLFVVTLLYAAVGHAGGVLVWVLGWLLLAAAYNLAGLDRHWMTKNSVFITLGTYVQIYQVASLRPSFAALPEVHRWAVVVSGCFGVTLHTQDFRDTHGDALVGRRTLPLEVGSACARLLTATLLAVVALGVPYNDRYSLLSFTLAVHALLVAVMLLTAPADGSRDRAVYLFHTLWLPHALLGLLRAR